MAQSAHLHSLIAFLRRHPNLVFLWNNGRHLRAITGDCQLTTLVVREGELNRGFTAENEIIEPVNEYSRLISLSPLSYLWTTLLDVLRWWVQCIATWVITLYLFLVTDVPFLLFVNLNAHTIIILVIKLFNNYSSCPNGLRVNSP